MSVRPHECVDRNDNVRGGATAIHIAPLQVRGSKYRKEQTPKKKKEIEYGNVTL